MMNKQALLIYNQLSGKKSSHRIFPFIEKRLSEMGYQLTVHRLKNFNDGENYIKEACQHKWEAIFIAGGDGTINYCLQSIAEEQNRPKIGIFPFGTSNEFSQYIGTSSNIEQALSIIEEGYLKFIDVGKLGDKYFANIASAGWLSDITYKTSPFLKSYLGEWAYVLSFLKTFFMTKQSISITMTVSPNEIISDLSLFLIMNGSGVGPINRLIKNSTKNTGYFHLLVCKKTKKTRLFIELLGIMLQVTKNSSIIHHTPIQSCKFLLPESLAVNLDGEKIHVKALHFEVLPQHLEVFSSTSEEK